MKKIVSYLMLVLCLFLFPFKVRALEVPEIDSDEVITENLIEEEKTNDLEDLVIIEDPQNVLTEVESTIEEETEISTTQDEEEPEEINEEKNIEAQEDAENTSQDDSSFEEGEDGGTTTSEDNLEEQTEPQVIEISEISIAGVSSELVGGEPFIFGGHSTEEEKYSVVREDWIKHEEITQISTTDSNYNNSLPEDYTYIESPDANSKYNYEILVTFKDGYDLAEEFTVIINGSEYAAYIDDLDSETNTYLLYTFYRLQALDKDTEYVELLQLENAVTEAYVDQAPLYGVSSQTDHIRVVGEIWTYYIESGSEEDYEYTVYTNASDPSLLEEYEIPFDKFESGKTYTYIIVVEGEAGYQLAYTVGSNNQQKYKVAINGEEKDYDMYGWLQEDGTYRYYIYVLDTTPIEAEEYTVVDNADPVVIENEIEDVTMTIESEESKIEAVYVDNELISEENYTTEENTILTLLASFLNTLGQGIHNITMKFTNGNMAYTTITIDKATEEDSSQEEPITNEPSAMPLTQNNTEDIKADYTVQLYSNEEKENDNKLEVREKEEEKEEQEKEEKDEDNNVGLIIFLIILILIAIIIPVTIYRKNS